MIITTSAKTLALSYLVAKQTNVSSLSLRLFSNNGTITDATTDAELTEVSSGNGYSPIALTGSSWSINPTGSTLSYPQQTWTFTGPKGNVYGYYVTNASGTVLWAEKFPTGPYNVQNNGDIINVNLSITIV